MIDLLRMLPAFGISLGLTLLFELIIARLAHLHGRDYLLVILVNILTNPAVVYLNLLCGQLFPDGRSLWQIPLELGAIAVEAVCYARFAHSVRRPWIFATVANVCSYGTGLLLTNFANGGFGI